MKISNKQLKIISNTLEELEGKAFSGSWQWTTNERKMYLDRYEKIFSFLPPIPTKAKVLEIGLCRGVLALLLKRLLPEADIYSLEHPKTIKFYSKIFLKMLSKENISLRPCDLNSNKLPYQDNCFDLVFFSEIMEHLVPATAFRTVKELKRVLKLERFLFLSTPNIASFLKRINLLIGKNPVALDTRLHQQATYGHIREYTMSEVVTLIESSGLEIVEKKYISFDVQRNLNLRIEDYLSLFFPPLSNALMIMATKKGKIKQV